MKKNSEPPATAEQTSYFYLWHLAALKVLDVEYSTDVADDVEHEPCPHISNTLWDRLNASNRQGRKARIALIDVGVSQSHPNLLGRVSNEDSIDLAAHPYGAKMAVAASPATGNKACEISAQYFAGLNIDGLSPIGLDEGDMTFLKSFVLELSQSAGVLRKFGDVEERFSSHGTAIAGLMVGGPSRDSNSSTPILPYFGVDPDSTLISIRTSFDNDPEQFLAALLYAWMQDTDVIVLPRGLPDPCEGPTNAKSDHLASLELWGNRSQNDLYKRSQQLRSSSSGDDPNTPILSDSSQRTWRVVKELFKEISKTIPVVCAAGNEGESQLIYPASLADRDNGIIAVGAVTAEGYRSGYSNYGDGLTVVAPSDDMEVLNRHQVRLDLSRPENNQEHITAESALRVPLSHQSLLSTDLPGHFGYDGDQQSDVYENGYYTLFGGTSGACALVGGVVALLRRAELAQDPSKQSRRDGRDIKELLQRTARIETSVVPGGRPLTVDRMNSDDEDANSLHYFFGAGLVDAEAALKQVFPELFDTD